MIKHLAGCIIADKSGRVLLLHRNTKRLSQWELPGGKVEPGEQPHEAARREILEETGLAVKSLKLVGGTAFDDNGVHWIYSWYRPGEVTGEPRVVETNTFDSFDYFNLDSAELDTASLSPNVIAITDALKSKRLRL